MPAPPIAIIVLLAACGGPASTDTAPPGGQGGDGGAGGGSGMVEGQDVLHTSLSLDLSTREGHAAVEVLPAPGATAVTLEVGGLTLFAVSVDGAPVEPTVRDGVLRVPVTSDAGPVTVDVDYVFPARSPATFDGWMPSLGVTFVWPDHCANLFPCHSDTADGVTFDLEITGVEDGATAVYPETTSADGPPYMPAVAVGDYLRLDLGQTSAGTALEAWYFDQAGALQDAEFGTQRLVSSFDFFERTYGPYSFGDRVGTVQVDWADDSWGGMEHHPLFHVGMYDFWNEEAQVHEAAHGWYGDGVRLACWEDFVLSEGTVTYITARAMEEVGGPDLWSLYVDDYLQPICTGWDVNAVVLPEGCNEIDFQDSDLWSLAPYMKGACFYEDVADLVGVDVVDQVIAEHYRTHVGGAGRMEEMIDLLVAAAPEHQAGIEERVVDWLQSLDCPADYATRCRARQR